MVIIKLKPGLYMATLRMRNRSVDSNIREFHLPCMPHGASKLRPIS